MTLYTLVSLFDDAQPLLITIFQKFALSFYVWVSAHQHSSGPSYRKWEPAKKWLKTFKGYSRRQFQYTFHGLLLVLNFYFQVQRLSGCLQTLKARKLKPVALITCSCFKKSCPIRVKGHASITKGINHGSSQKFMAFQQEGRRNQKHMHLWVSFMHLIHKC